MSYCSVADIQADFKATTFSNTSLVTSAAVTQFILEAGALIDSLVGQRWVTPITADTSSLALMSLYCRTLVSNRVRGILYNKQTTNVDANQNVKADSLSTKDIMTFLNQIKNGEMNLSGATLLNSNASFFSNNFDRNIQPKFNKQRKQW